MNGPEAADVRRQLSGLDLRGQKIVAGLLSVMLEQPARVRDREWIAEQLTRITILAGGFDGDSLHEGVRAVQVFLEDHAAELLRAAYLLFQRVAQDLGSKTGVALTHETIMRRGLAYLPSFRDTGEAVHGSQRELGEQPIARMMAARSLTPSDLVAASGEQLTHKMVARAMKGRRLTANTMGKVQRAWNRAAGCEDGRDDLFDYVP